MSENNNHRSLGELILHRTGNKPVLESPAVAAAKAGIGGVIVKKDSRSLDDRIEYELWANGYADAYANWFRGEDGYPLMEKSRLNYKQKIIKSLGLTKADVRSQNILSTMETVQSAYVAPSVSGIGPAKQMLTEWWFNPIWGQPRLVDLRTIKQLARSHVGSMAIESILDQIMQVGWDVIPKDLLHPNLETTQKQIDVIKSFLDDPNRNHDDFDKILRMYIRNILETDDGTLVMVYDEYVSPPVPQTQYAATGEIRAYTAQPAWDAIPAPDARLIEVFAEDGASFLKQVDMHGYLMNYWQYSFTVPRRPVRFEAMEIVYTSQNPRSGSPYGYSPFESVVDTLKFIIEAFKYNRAFFENCIREETPIVTNPAVKNIEDIAIGDRVLSSDGGFEEVTNKFVYEYNGSMIRVKPIGSPAFECTPQHRLVVRYNGGQERFEEAEHIYGLSNLNIDLGKGTKSIFGEFKGRKRTTKRQFLKRFQLKIPRIKDIIDTKVVQIHNSDKKGHINHTPKFVDVDNDFMRFLGLFVAEGDTGDGVQFSFNKNESEYYMFVKSILEHRLDLKTKVFDYCENGTGVKAYSIDLVKWLQENFYSNSEHTARYKVIPDWIMKLPFEKQRAFLDGLYEGDGTPTINGRSLTTVSKMLAYQVRMLWTRLGIWSTFYNYGSTYMINVVDRLSIKQGHRRFEITDDAIYVKIASIEKVPYVGKVYDLTVSGNHTYVPNMIATHNSAIPSLHIDFEFIKDPKDLKALDDWIRETFVGSDKAYRVLTTNGGVNVKTLNFTNRDLQMLELQTFYLNLVLAKLKVPAELLGIRPATHAGYASRGSMGTQAALMRSRAIKPILTLVENSFNMHMIPKILQLPRTQCLAQFKFGPMTDLDEQERKAKIYQAYLSTGLGYINEFRISEGKDPVPWGYFPFIPQVGLVHPLEPYSVQWYQATMGKGGQPGQSQPGGLPRQIGETPQTAKPPETPAQASPGPSSVESLPKPEEGVGAEVPSITHAGGQPILETQGPTGKMWHDPDLEQWLLDKLAEHSHLIRKGRKYKTIDLTKKVHSEVLNANVEAGKKLKTLLVSARDSVVKGEDPDIVESKTLDGARKVINNWLEMNALLAKQDVAKEMKLPIPKELSAKEISSLKTDKDKAFKDFHGVLMDMILALKSKLVEKK